MLLPANKELMWAFLSVKASLFLLTYGSAFQSSGKPSSFPQCCSRTAQVNPVIHVLTRASVTQAVLSHAAANINIVMISHLIGGAAADRVEHVPTKGFSGAEKPEFHARSNQVD